MKIWIKNNQGKKDHYVNVSFWSLFKAYIIISLVASLIFYTIIVILVNIFAGWLGLK